MMKETSLHWIVGLLVFFSGAASPDNVTVVPGVGMATLSTLSAFTIDIKITNRIYNDSLKDQQSLQYRTLREDIESLFSSIFRYSPSVHYQGISEMTFSNGSVIASSLTLFGTTQISEAIVKNTFADNYEKHPFSMLDLNISYTKGSKPSVATFPLILEQNVSIPFSVFSSTQLNTTSRNASTTNHFNSRGLTTSTLDHTTRESTTRTLGHTTRESTTRTLGHTTRESTTRTLDHTTRESTTRTLGHTTRESTTRALDHTTRESTTRALDHTTRESTTRTLGHTTRESTTRTLGHTTRESTTRTLGHTTRESTTHTLGHTTRESTTHTLGHTTRESTTRTLGHVSTLNSKTLENKTTTAFSSNGSSIHSNKTDETPTNDTMTVPPHNLTLATSASSTHSTRSTHSAPTASSVESKRTQTPEHPAPPSTAAGVVEAGQGVPGWGIALLVMAAIILFLLLVLLILLLLCWCCCWRRRGFLNVSDPDPLGYYNPDIPMHSTYSTFDSPNGRPPDTHSEKHKKTRTGMYLVNE